MKSYLYIIFCILFLIQVSYAGDPVYKSPIYKSPNAKNEIYCEAFFGGAASKWSITFLQNSNNLFGITIPAEKDVREIKVSWSPSSDAAILGLNSKAGEDWILVRFTNGNVVFSYIDGDKSVNAKLLNAASTFRVGGLGANDIKL